MEFIFVGLIWFVAGFINGLSGMGAALVAVPLLSLLLDIQIIIPLACIMVTTVCGLLAWHFREFCEFKSVLPFIISSIPGSIVGAYLLKYIPTVYLQIAMSLFLISYVLWSLTYNKQKKEPRENYILALLCGFISGLTGASISFSGPPIAVYVIYAGWTAQKSLVTFGLGIFFISLITCIMHASTGLYTQALLPYVLVAIPAVSIGMFLSFPLIKYITQSNFKIILLVVIGISGIVSGIRAIFQLGIL